ncbi:MAG: alpha/beta hydrolase [Paludibacteraceae bacterium]|nr:alpha/beta hydrolase [Paludibacteraceae bacterium]
MKPKLLLLTLALCSVMALPATDYVMLSPLDTAVLPEIPTKDHGGDVVRSVLNKNGIWQNTQRNLRRQNFSDKSIYKVMKQLYQYTHKHFVTFPVAYWSQTPQGDSLLVSGRVYLPKNRILNGIIVANHYTMTSDEEVPSNRVSMEMIFLMKGYAVIMPDYVGYGLSREEVHPYLHWRNAAQTAVDLLNCMPELLDYYGYSYPKDVVVTGYSQGGAVALGVARMIEENYHQENEWTVRKLYAGAGPYDPAGTYLFSMERNEMGIPAAIPLIVMGLNDAYELGFTLDEFFLDPLLSNYEDWVVSKEYTVGQINQLMGSTIMSELMTEDALTLDSPQADMLYEVLLWNSNVGYDLQAPAYFLHSLEDEVVPLLNSINLEAEMPDKEEKTFDFDYYGSHMEASVPFIQYVYQDL